MMSLLVILLWIVVLAIGVHLVLWVLNATGLTLPSVIVRLVWVAFVLVVLIWLLSGPLSVSLH